MWSEYLDFFFLRDTKPHERIEDGDWWNKLDAQGAAMQVTLEEDLDAKEGAEGDKENKDKNNAQGMSGDAAYKAPIERKQVKDTPSLRVLQNSRQNRIVRDVEDEFKQLAADRKSSTKQTASSTQPQKKVPQYESLDIDADGGAFGFGREKSKNLLLNSQSAIMLEIFENLDKYHEGILRRSQYVMALRTDERVIDFIDCEAVKKAYSNTTMTLDAVLLEIEKDERYDQSQQSRTADQINHKEFITWREFLNYFNDYQEIEARNKQKNHMQAAK